MPIPWLEKPLRAHQIIDEARTSPGTVERVDFSARRRQSPSQPAPALPPAQPGNALTWWFSGLPGVGKTTLAQALAQAMRSQGQAACVLDGDDLRQGRSSDLVGVFGRHRQNRRTAEICRMLNANQIHAIVALASATRQASQAARAIVGHGRFIEVFVSTPLAVCEQRDSKGLYSRAASQECLKPAGLPPPHELPICAEFTIDTSQTTEDQAVALLLASLYSKFPAPREPDAQPAPKLNSHQ